MLNENGDAVLDASIMDGRDLTCGAVAGVRRIRNPISAARKVITETSHILLMADGADRFAEKVGLEMVDPDYFKTAEQIENWKKWKERDANSKKTTRSDPLSVDDPLFYLGTVGCVVLDTEGI